MPKIDQRYSKLLADHIVNAKGFYDYGIERGLVRLEDMRMTIAKRQEVAKALISGGVSQRKAAKALGVHRSTVRRDTGKLNQGGSKRSGNGSTRPGKVKLPEPGEAAAPARNKNERHEQVREYISRALNFMNDFSNSFRTWHQANPTLAKDDHEALVDRLHNCANEFTLLAQLIDGR